MGKQRKPLEGVTAVGRALAGVGLGLAVGLSGCALVPPNSFLDPTKVGRFPLEYQENGIRRVLTPRDTPPGIAGAAEPTPDDLIPDYSEHRITPGDQVAVSIDDLITQGIPVQLVREVTPTGYLRIPQVGAIKVVGLTEMELEEEIANRVREQGLLPDPIVQAVVQLRRNEFFLINGDVRGPGPYTITQKDLRVLEAITLAGDLGPTVKTIYVIRRTDRGQGLDSEPLPPTTPGEERELIIPPPTEEGLNFQQTSFASFGDLGQETQPSQPARPAQPEEDLRAMEEIVAPRSQETQPTSEPAPEAEPQPFRPLIFPDPTGERTMEAEEPAPQELPAEPEARQPARGPGAELPEAFDWEALPEEEITQRVIEIDVGALKAGDPRMNIVVRNRDVIVAPVDTGLFYIMGEVNRPGVYAFNGREITIKQAIGAIAGGFSPLAWPQRCEIIRREKGTDKQLTIPVNLDAVFAGLEEDVLLRDDDVINVGTHTLAPFLFVIRNSFRFTYGFGFVYDRNFADKDAYGSRINPEIIAQQRRQQRGLPF